MGKELQHSVAFHREPVEEWRPDAWPGAEDTELGILHHTHPLSQNYFSLLAQNLKVLCLSRYTQDVTSDIWEERWPCSRRHFMADRG